MALANRLGVRQLRPGEHTIDEPVTVCIPARDEAARLPALIADLRAQQGIPNLRVLILDDASTDGTHQAAAAAIDADRRFTLMRNDIEPPAGWNGKTAACARLARHARIITAETAVRASAQHGIAALDSTATGHLAPRPPGEPQPSNAPGAVPASAGTLIFLDADIRIAPTALASAVSELRRTGAALVCPWPLQLAESAAERLVQPLLCWSWAATLPVPLANRTAFPSMAVACGQFLVFDAAAYQALGGHTAVANDVTEDLAIARALRRTGALTTLVAAGPLARTRMYRNAGELEDGYTRWLWSAYGGVLGSAAVAGLAATAYWVPPLAAALGRGKTRRTGLLGYAAAITTRLLARSTETGGQLGLTDIRAALAHPLAVAAYLRLSAMSHRAHRHGGLTWKGRALTSDR
ncbi:glycosyltransferase [Nocardia sp. 2]|uniref:Glycosyltransferase n=1 Tax=Nocardia acididurans TaxID=2802282 RepID=A0ABS1MDH2_9NOCA|nr:glycosyltransferase [Nocardia acididurans]MBL1077784.1 glycosyltransferase [Nocardia acididurans]